MIVAMQNVYDFAIWSTRSLLLGRSGRFRAIEIRSFENLKHIGKLSALFQMFLTTHI